MGDVAIVLAVLCVGICIGLTVRQIRRRLRAWRVARVAVRLARYRVVTDEEMLRG